MKLLLVYPPFCAPTIMPYSISYLKNFVENNLKITVKNLDLNAKFHRQRFPEFYLQVQTSTTAAKYAQVLEKFENTARDVYALNHKKVIHDESPELLQEMIELICHEQPDIVAFSFVYNSQGFYGKVLLEELSQRGIKCIIGGPAVHGQLKHPNLKNEVELMNWLAAAGAKLKYQEEHYHGGTIPDFRDFPAEDYLSRARVVPIKTCSTCFYKLCAFCTHYADVPYLEYNLENIRTTIIQSGAKHVCFIDDMISRNRLLELAQILAPLHITWWCQLRPTKDLLGLFPQLYSSGLRSVAWGIESGSQRILNLMKKGTHVEDVSLILAQSHIAGIKNMAYVMFGFPSETKEEFMDTIRFLQDHSPHIDLVSTSVFGLQSRSVMYLHPQEFGISVQRQKRTVLDDKITYISKTGLQHEEAKRWKRKYRRTLRKLNKLPGVFDYFKEQVLVFS